MVLKRNIKILDKKSIHEKFITTNQGDESAVATSFRYDNDRGGIQLTLEHIKMLEFSKHLHNIKEPTCLMNQSSTVELISFRNSFATRKSAIRSLDACGLQN